MFPVLLIILLIMWLLSKRKPDYLIGEPDQDVRENIGFYDEEGPGSFRYKLLCFTTI